MTELKEIQREAEYPNPNDYTHNGELMQPHYDNSVRAWEKLQKVEAEEKLLDNAANYYARCCNGGSSGSGIIQQSFKAGFKAALLSIPPEYRIDEQTEQMTGYKTLAEWKVNQETTKAQQEIMLKLIEEWDGQKGSRLGEVLYEKFEEIIRKKVW